jgi:hypothetical protein
MPSRLAVLPLLFVLTLPALAAKHVNLKQLEQLLADATGKSDPELAHTLAGMELSERMSSQRLAKCRAMMPGQQSFRALEVLASSAEFLNLPPDDVPSTPPLDARAQQDLLALASTYISTTLAKLPNFMAAETVTTFQDSPVEHLAG